MQVLKHVAIATAFVIVSAGLTACKGGDSDSGDGSGPLTIGLLTSLTGPVAPSFHSSQKGAQARIDYQNANGGVNGRQLKLEVADDAGSPQTALAAAQDLVENKDALVLASVSVYIAGAARYLQQRNFPVVGGAWSGPEWGTEGNENMFGDTGSVNPKTPSYTSIASLLQSKGATKLASINVNTPSSTVGGAAVAYAFEQAGAEIVYKTSSISLGAPDLTSTALAIKESGADGFYSSMDGGANTSLAKALKQADYKPEVMLYGNGYGQPTIDDATVNAAFQDAYFSAWLRPVELGGPGIDQMMEAFAAVGVTGIPDFAAYEGYIAADLAIKGLEVAGDNPTPSAIVEKLRQVTDYDAGGLTASPVNFRDDFGKGGVAPQVGTNACFYVVQLKGKKFVPDPEPQCGELIPDSDQR